SKRKQRSLFDRTNQSNLNTGTSSSGRHLKTLYFTATKTKIMFKLLAATLLLSTGAPSVAQGAADAPISMDDIEEAKAGRLMKNRGDVDVQSTYHEDDIKETVSSERSGRPGDVGVRLSGVNRVRVASLSHLTSHLLASSPNSARSAQGDVPDERSARLVRNRGPITAKVVASASHSGYCADRGDASGCAAKLSLSAWKFAGDEGEVRGLLEERLGGGDGDGGDATLHVDLDCMARSEDGTAAVVGGTVAGSIPNGHPAAGSGATRAYVRVVDGGRGSDGEGDFVSGVHFDDGIGSHCRSSGVEAGLAASAVGGNVDDARVSVCSKRRDWEGCLAKMRAEQAVE
ncbi:hypothetical protein ACHAWF_003844, partial [Thalassiosira exigua]